MNTILTGAYSERTLCLFKSESVPEGDALLKKMKKEGEEGYACCISRLNETFGCLHLFFKKIHFGVKYRKYLMISVANLGTFTNLSRIGF